MTVLDLHWLQASARQVRAAETPAQRAEWKRRLRQRLITGAVVFAVFVVIELVVFLIVPPDPADRWIAFLVVGFMVASVCVALFKHLWLDHHRDDIIAMRLQWTARANGFEYKPAGLPVMDVMLLHQGHGAAGGRFFIDGQGREFGSLSYETGSGSNRTETHYWHYIAARLPAPLPHLVLGATAGERFRNGLPEHIDAHQRLRLEGDFDKHFALFAPIGYQDDALYVFTPDVMASFIDNASHYDVEINGDVVIFFAKGTADYLKPEPWREADRVFGTAIAALDERASRYRDERVAKQAPRAIDQAASTGEIVMRPVVAPQGRVLKVRRALTSGGLGLGALFVGMAVVVVVSHLIVR
jgi:hypothetical protein